MSPAQPRRLVCLVALLLAPGLPAVAEEAGEASAFESEEAKRWAVHTARMEGASVNIEEAAQELHQTALEVSRSGRLSSLAELSSDVAQLNRRVISAALAAEVLDD